MSKNYRHIAIKEIIESEAIGNQSTLLDLLVERGFELTQATLSRDIKELKIVKAPDKDGEYIYQYPNSSKDKNEEASVGFKFISFEFSGQLAVAKTKPGYAMGMAGEIDQDESSCILGTVAGDDTILLIPREGRSKQEILDALSDYLPDNLLK